MNFCNVKKFLACLCFVVVSQCNCLNVSIECKSEGISDSLHYDDKNVAQTCNIKCFKEFVHKIFDRDDCFFSEIIVNGSESSMLNIEDDILSLKTTGEHENKPFCEIVIGNATLHTENSLIEKLIGIELQQRALIRIDELYGLSKDLKIIEAFYKGFLLGSRQQINFELMHEVGGFASEVDQLNIEVDGRNYSIEHINDDINVLNQAVSKGYAQVFEAAIRNATLHTGKSWVGSLRGRFLQQAARARVEQLKEAIRRAELAERDRLRVEIERMRAILNSSDNYKKNPNLKD